MTATQFVDTIKEMVLDASVEDALAMASDPPGRRPPVELVELSRWLKALSATDRAKVKQMLQLVAQHAVFGFLSVLDGTRQVEPLGPKGHFELRFVKDGHVHILSGPQGELLHELLS